MRFGVDEAQVFARLALFYHMSVDERFGEFEYFL